MANHLEHDCQKLKDWHYVQLVPLFKYRQKLDYFKCCITIVNGSVCTFYNLLLTFFHSYKALMHK